MKILGISSNYHDASASLVIDGKVVAAAAEERFSYEKHDPSFPHHSIAFCLKEAGITAQELDYVMYHEDPQTKFSRSLSSSFKNFPFSINSFLKTAKDFLTIGFWIKNDISKSLNIDPGKIAFTPHHMSHAAQAFFTSTFENSAIMTIDAVGEWSTACIFKGGKNENGYFIEPLDLIPFPHSLGLVYSAFTGFLGFKVNDGECSTMALAAFGSPSYADQIRKIILSKEDNTFSIDLSYFDFSSDNKLPLTQKFLDIFGEPRELQNSIKFSSLQDLKVDSVHQIRFANIAASIQLVTEEIILNFAKRVRTLTNSENLCYAGGVALNCVANSKLANSGLFKNIFIPSDPGDGGGAMGAALYGAMIFDSTKLKPHSTTVYLGKEFNQTSEFKSLIENLDPKMWHKQTLLKIRSINKEDLIVQEFFSDDDLTNFVAQKIFEKKAVGWFQGRFESGPRALGNRSILCRPDCIETALRLSSTIKTRSSFRPYACSILKDDAREYLEIENEIKLGSWMQSSFKIKNDKVKDLRAASHTDQTTRAQILSRNDNELYYKLITKFKLISGIPALLNTSFNMNGFPIVTSPTDALLMFARTNLDIIVVNNIVVSKRLN